MSVAFSIIISAVAVYIVAERRSGLKHLQLISGMQLKSYWIGNFIFDFAKMYITILTAVILFFAFSMDYKAAYVTLLVLPFGILPFTYMTSFILTAETAASTFTLFLHITVLGILSTVIFTFRIAVPDFQNTGD